MKEINEIRNLQTKEVREQVFEQLVMKITMGDWKPGDKIPSENELASMMGVSRLSVREAIQKLSAINLVETLRGKGTYVKAFSSNSYIKSMTPMLYMNADDIYSVVQYRRILEVGIIDILMARIENKDIEYLKKALQKMIYYYDKNNLVKYKEYDLAFHMRMYEMTDNPFIIKISNIVRDIIGSAIGGALTEQGAKEGIEFHGQIIECIEANDAEHLKVITNQLFDEIESDVQALKNKNN